MAEIAIFTKMTHNIDPTLVARQAVERIEAARERLRLTGGRPWSTAELGLGDGDINWLKNWANKLKYVYLSRTIAGPKDDQAAIGLLLVCLSAELGRRNKRLTNTWSALGRSVNPMGWYLLCDDGKRLTSAAVKLFAEAGYAFNLRRPPCISSNEDCIALVEQQFGFSAGAFKTHGYDWLNGADMPTAVSQLLDMQSGSHSFRAWWGALIRLAEGKLSSAEHVDLIDNNFWTAPLKTALSEMPFQSAEQPVTEKALANAVNGHLVEVEEDSDGESSEFLTAPRLFWPEDGRPIFTTLVTALDKVGLTQDRYVLTLQGEKVRDIQLMPDGSYRVAPSEALEVELDASEIVAQILTVDGQLVARCNLTFWLPVDDLTIYDLHDGRQLEPAEGLSQNRSYALLLASDLVLLNAPKNIMRWSGRNPQVVRIGAPWSERIRVTLDGEEFWTPVVGDGQLPPNPTWTKYAKIKLTKDVPVYFGSPVTPILKLENNLTLCWARAGGKPLAIERAEDGYSLGPLTVHPGVIKGGKILVQLGLRNGTEFCPKEVALACEILGACIETPETVKPLFRNEVLQVNGTVSLRPQLPAKDKTATYNGKRYSRWVLMEGDRPHDCLKPSGGSVTVNFAGLGAPLCLVKDPYSSYPNRFGLASEVRQTGVIEKLVDGPTGWLQLQLAREIEPDTSHRIVLWMADGNCRQIVPTPTAANFWRFRAAAELDGIIAIAVTYRDDRLGGYWPIGWHQRIEQVFSASPTETAHNLRWFGCPVLSAPARLAIRRLVLENLDDCLTAWHPMRGEHDRLSPDSIWWAAIAELLGDTGMDELTSLMLVEHHPSAKAVEGLAGRLMSLDPVLASRLIYVWAESEGMTDESVATITRLRDAYTSLDEVNRSISTCEKMLRISPGFILGFKHRVRDIITGDLDPPFCQVLRAGILGFPDFKRIIAWYVLSWLALNLKRRPLCRS